MYFVDREKIEETLQFMEKRLTMLKAQQTWHTEVEKAALERAAETVIEAVLDVGNALIDGFIMRDPGSYKDIIDILLDEKVLPAETAKKLTEVIAFRKQLVRGYTRIDHEALGRMLLDHLGALGEFPERIRVYLANELGPVNAFKGE
ncbi:DUF86 domain-containing protein [Heyndrickxia acidiproducens]|uniref:DUF86 domain-containing protein n=1 Tax=Heyndrickxia acidiproducens TaxID=1121084 RepID=UPI00037FCC29|nr:DUF86 domain-containing protein [Heyndrickxia acidiproducens]